MNYTLGCGIIDRKLIDIPPWILYILYIIFLFIHHCCFFPTRVMKCCVESFNDCNVKIIWSEPNAIMLDLNMYRKISIWKSWSMSITKALLIRICSHKEKIIIKRNCRLFFLEWYFLYIYSSSRQYVPVVESINNSPVYRYRLNYAASSSVRLKRSVVFVIWLSFEFPRTCVDIYSLQFLSDNKMP